MSAFHLKRPLAGSAIRPGANVVVRPDADISDGPLVAVVIKCDLIANVFQENAMMLIGATAASLAFFTIGASGVEPPFLMPVPQTVVMRSEPSRLSETASDTAVLQVKLKELQVRLRRSELLYFGLIAGAPASYDETNQSPRQVFLEASFDHPNSIIRLAPDTYKIEFKGSGDRGLMLDVTVVLDFYGDVGKVELFSRPPHPF